MHLYHRIAFSLQFLPDWDLLPEFGLSRLIFLKDVAVADGIETLFDEALSPHPLEPLHHNLLAYVIFSRSCRETAGLPVLELFSSALRP
jgi:hypothetical protein